MRIIFYDSKSYDKQSFDKALRYFSDISIEYMVADLDARTAVYSKGYDAVCAFVNSVIDADVLKILYDNGIRLVLMRCAGYNNVDVNAADRLGITVMRVPGYSPEAVAELAMGLALAAQRRIHKAYIKVRENNFSLQGLTGVTLHGKTAGIVGTGKIGAAMCRICNGFGMKVIAYDRYRNESLDFVEYVELDRLLSESDLISLHCPLEKEIVQCCLNLFRTIYLSGFQTGNQLLCRQVNIHHFIRFLKNTVGYPFFHFDTCNLLYFFVHTLNVLNINCRNHIDSLVQQSHYILPTLFVQTALHIRVCQLVHNDNFRMNTDNCI